MEVVNPTNGIAIPLPLTTIKIQRQIDEGKKMIQLWSKRWSTARGWHWKLERECELANSQEWLAVFRKCEPEIEFKLSNKKPKN